jgi:hypothetical protein
MPNAICTDAGTCGCAPFDCTTINMCGDALPDGCGSVIDCPCVASPEAAPVAG